MVKRLEENWRTSGVLSMVIVVRTAVWAFIDRVFARLTTVSRGGGAVSLRRALIGAQEHLVLGGALRSAGLLLHQELLEPVGGEGESLTLELHQVGVLQPGLGKAVSGRRTGPESSEKNISAAQAGPE